MKIGSFVGIVLLGSLGAVVAGCSTPPPRSSSDARATRAVDPGTTRPASQGLAVGEDLARLCDLPASDVERAPKFDYDRSELSTSDRDVLAKIARCLTSGPLKGRGLKLVGRADARGEPEYNLGLGEHRADSVKHYLSELGVDTRRISETSRGELDATGRDEATWRRDRRVDVLLQ